MVIYKIMSCRDTYQSKDPLVPLEALAALEEELHCNTSGHCSVCENNVTYLMAPSPPHPETPL